MAASIIIHNMKFLNLFRHENVRYLMAFERSFRDQNWTQQRRSIHLPNPFTKKYNFRPLDAIPNSYECVYKNTLNNYIVYTYPLCAFGAVTSFVIGGLMVIKGLDVKVYVEFLNSFVFDDLYEMLLVMPLMGFSTLVFKMIVDRCVLRIYYNEAEQKFIGVLASIIPWKVRKFTFECGQVKHLYPFGSPTTTLRTFMGEYSLGKQKLIIFPPHFKLPYYYNIMVGYGNEIM